MCAWKLTLRLLIFIFRFSESLCIKEGTQDYLMLRENLLIFRCGCLEHIYYNTIQYNTIFICHIRHLQMEKKNEEN